MPGIGLAPGGSMVMEDVCDLQPRAAHGRRTTLRLSAALRSAERAGRAGWSQCGSSYWRRGCKGRWYRAWHGRAAPRPSPGQALDDADVGVLFQQMRGEAGPQRMRRHSLLDAGGLGRGMDGAVELAGCERLKRIAARKQPAPRQQHTQASAVPPPGAQQLEQLRRQHGMAVPRLREGRLLRPLPCSTRSSIRSESTSPTLSATTSETRSPAP